METKEPTIQDSSTDSLRLFSKKLLILIAFVAGIYTLSLLTSVLVILFFSGFLTILFSPFLENMNKKRVPDWLGIIFIFVGILLFFFVAFFAIMPIFIKQIALLFSYIGDLFITLEGLYKSGGINALGFPSFIKEYIQMIDLGIFFGWARDNASSISGVIASLSKNLLQNSTSFISSLSGGIFQMVMIGIFTFFMSLERKSIKDFIYDILPKGTKKYLVRREDDFLKILTSWLKGQLILSFSIFVLTFIGLFFLRIWGIQIDNIFTLSLIAGLMEFIPYVGPFLALLPALALAIGMGIVPVVAILILYILIQQAENNILVPMVMSKTLDLSPFLILLMMMMMANLFGIVGVLVALPFTGILQVIVKDILVGRKGEEQGSNLTKKGKRI